MSLENESAPEQDNSSLYEQISEWTSFREVMNKIIESDEPPSPEVISAFDEAKGAGTLESLNNALLDVRNGLAGYDPVKHETDAHDARAMVERMLTVLNESNES